MSGQLLFRMAFAAGASSAAVLALDIMIVCGVRRAAWAACVLQRCGWARDGLTRKGGPLAAIRATGARRMRRWLRALIFPLLRYAGRRPAPGWGRRRIASEHTRYRTFPR